MGKLALAAKITHVPSMYLSELEGDRKGSRQDAIDGHLEIDRRCRAAGVDTIVVFNTHWLVNANYHINCAPHFEGTYTSNELPHFISNMKFGFPGNPALGFCQCRRALRFVGTSVRQVVGIGKLRFERAGSLRSHRRILISAAVHERRADGQPERCPQRARIDDGSLGRDAARGLQRSNFFLAER